MSPATARFVGRRALAAVGVLLVVSLLVFGALYAAPGSPEEAIVGGQNASPQVLAAVRVRYGLDHSVAVQYLTFVEHAARLDFGTSFQSREPVLSGIVERLGITVPLGLAAFALAVALGIGGGVLAAVRRGTVVDRGATALSVVAASVPAYATGVLLLYVFGVVLGWLPLFGGGGGGIDRVRHLVLPVIALALTGMAPVLRLTRLGMIEALERDDVAFARARGIGRGTVLVRYALRHTLVLVTTASSIVFLHMLTAAAVVEVAFNLRGVGSFLVDAVEHQDIPVVQGTVLLIAALVLVVNLASDLLYAVIDPRISHGRAVA